MRGCGFGEGEHQAERSKDMNTFTCVSLLLSNSDFLQLLGWCFAAAIAVGGIIDESPKKLGNWIFAAVVFAVTEGVLRYFYRMNSGFNDTFLCESNAITINITITYVIGLTAGWMIVYFGKRHGRNSYIKQSEKLFDEKEIQNERN